MLKQICKLAVVTAVATLITACAPTGIAKKNAFPRMYEQQPQSILVVPAINNSTAAEASDYLSTTLAMPLSHSGYYVLPIEITSRMLKEAGISDGHQLAAVSPSRLGEMFGADSVLFVSINRWNTSYYVIGGNVTVGLAYELKSTKSGDTLWQYQDELKIDTSGNSNNGAGLLGAIIETAIKTASQDYLPIAQQVNYIAMSSIPLGKHHPTHSQDGETLVNGDKAGIRGGATQ